MGHESFGPLRVGTSSFGHLDTRKPQLLGYRRCMGLLNTWDILGGWDTSLCLGHHGKLRHTLYYVAACNILRQSTLVNHHGMYCNLLLILDILPIPGGFMDRLDLINLMKKWFGGKSMVNKFTIKCYFCALFIDFNTTYRSFEFWYLCQFCREVKVQIFLTYGIHNKPLKFIPM